MSAGHPIDNESFIHKDASKIFEEVLDAEVFVNLDKVRNAARRGIPHEHRGRLYRFLLGVTSFDKSSEMTFRQRRGEDFAILSQSSSSSTTNINTSSTKQHRSGGILTGVWGEIRVALRNGVLLKQLDIAEKFVALNKTARHNVYEKVLDAFEVAHCRVTHEEAAVIVKLSIPFAAVFEAPQDIFFCTDALLNIMKCPGNMIASNDALRDHTAQFLTLFHATNDELYTHLVEEGISPLHWAPDMLETLLAGHLPIVDVLRLWDLYITDVATCMGFPIHLFVCLAILEEFTEALCEMQHEDIMEQLRFFRILDMDSTLRRASSIREDVRSRGLIPTE